jgi:hypothetical protein
MKESKLEIPLVTHTSVLRGGMFNLLGEYEEALSREKYFFAEYGNFIIITKANVGYKDLKDKHKARDIGEDTYMLEQIEMPKKTFLSIVEHLEKILLKRGESKGRPWSMNFYDDGDKIEFKRGVFEVRGYGFVLTNYSRAYKNFETNISTYNQLQAHKYPQQFKTSDIVLLRRGLLDKLLFISKNLD